MATGQRITNWEELFTQITPPFWRLRGVDSEQTGNEFSLDKRIGNDHSIQFWISGILHGYCRPGINHIRNGNCHEMSLSICIIIVLPHEWGALP